MLNDYTSLADIRNVCEIGFQGMWFNENIKSDT